MNMKVTESDWKALLDRTTKYHFRTVPNTLILALEGSFTIPMLVSMAEYLEYGAVIQVCYYDELKNVTKIRLREPEFESNLSAFT